MKFKIYFVSVFLIYCFTGNAQYQLRNGSLSTWSNLGTSMVITQATEENVTAQISVLHGGETRNYTIHFTMVNAINTRPLPELSITPNPSNGKIAICNIYEDGLSNLNIVDLNGKIVDCIKNIKTSKIDLDLSRLENGIYFIQYSNYKYQKTYKIVVNQ